MLILGEKMVFEGQIWSKDHIQRIQYDPLKVEYDPRSVSQNAMKQTKIFSSILYNQIVIPQSSFTNTERCSIEFWAGS